MVDPRVKRFLDERLRVRVEQIRAVILALVREDLSVWDTQISKLVPNNAKELLDDGRASEGISRLSGADVYTIMEGMRKLLSQIDTEADKNAITKAAIRPLDVTLPGVR